MRLEDYNTLAYEFAIRNPRVIELLEMELTDEVVKELLIFGIDATSVHFDEDQEIRINSLQELYLDYDHLTRLEHVPHSPYGEGQWEDEETHEKHDDFRGHKLLIHPLREERLMRKESIEDAIPRIKELIETRGGKLRRLMNGLTFNHYDGLTFFDESVYSLDTSKNTSKTINSDEEFINEWINPKKYLQLIPQYKHISE